jgi:hypothetical protein
MTTDAFVLHVPLDEAYLALVPEVAGRYAELLGGSAADGTALTAAVKAAIDRVGAGADVHATIDMRFRPDHAGVRVDLVCGTRRDSVRLPIPVAKP